MVPKNDLKIDNIIELGGAGEIHSTFFVHCLGVFQGGGCRAAALAGAYKAAVECGVNFVEVAGTSAGSILAALIGANAQADYVCRKLEKLDFCELLGKPELQDGYKNKFLRSIAHGLKFVGGKKISRILLYGGLYSSKPIEVWMNKELSKLLPDANRIVRFRDLLTPTRIVATDLLACKAKIWGTEETPNDSVAFAVRASCSIPFFFQPVVQGNNRFVDGGLLSNLPAFVYANGSNYGQSLTNRILAFRLKEEAVLPNQWLPSELLKRLIAAVIDGATELQMELKGNVYAITIPTGSIKATDFKQINKRQVTFLIEAGRTATLEFLRDEWRYVYHDRHVSDFCQDRDETYYAFVEEAESPLVEVLIAEYDTKWFWKLFPTILHWRLSDTQVKVLLGTITGNNPERMREISRREILKEMGVVVKEVDEIVIAGYTFRRLDETMNTAVVYGAGEDEFVPFATRYSGKAHRQVISGIRKTILGQLNTSQASASKLECVCMDAGEIIQRLKAGVGQYSKDSVKMELMDVSISQIYMLTKYIRGYKYKQIPRLIEVYRNAGVDLFSPMKVKSENDFSSPVGPPVLEVHDDRFVAIEGHTRIYHCWRNGITKIKCLCVRGVSDPLPAKPVKLEEIQIASRELPPEVRMPNYNHSHFRSIEGALRPVSR